jgi:hypothetical protein
MAAAKYGTFAMPAFSRLFALSAIAALTCTLAACKREQPAEPAKPVTAIPAPKPAPTREQAMASLMELPEIKAWSAQIEKASHGKAHGAVIEDDPAPRLINGKPYWQFSFVENRADAVHRRESFLVAQSGNDILVDDVDSDTLLTLHEWRRQVHRVEIRSKD